MLSSSPRVRRAVIRSAAALSAVVLLLGGVAPAGAAPSDASVPLSKVSTAGAWSPAGVGARVGGSKGFVVRAGQTRNVKVPSRKGLSSAKAPLLVQVTVLGAKKPGTLALWTAGGARPPAGQVKYAAGTTSTTALVVTDARGRIAVRGDRTARVTLDVLGRFRGSPSTKPAPGGTAVVASHVLVDRAAQRGAWPTRVGHEVAVPVLGVGAVPTSGVRAVWVAVQARSTKAGNLSFRTSGSGSALKGAVRHGASWSTTLVLAPVENDGTVRLRASGSVPTDLRIVVSGWVAEQASGQESSATARGIVLTAEQKVAPRLVSTTGGRRAYKLSAAPGVPTNARELVVALRLTSTTSGEVRAGATTSALRASSSQRTRVSRGQSTRIVLVAPLRAGATYVSVPAGTRVVGATSQAYLAARAARTADRAAPKLTITSHRDGAKVDGTTTPRITLAGTVVDRGSGVRRVEILGDGARLGTATIDTSRRTPRWTFETAVPDGTHRLTAVASDRAGRSTTRTIRLTSVAPKADAVVVAPRVEVMPASLTSRVSAVDTSSVTITGAAPSVEIGDVVVAGSTPTTPDGIARRVEAVELVEGSTVLRTRQAELTEIFEQVDLTIRGVPVVEGSADPARTIPAGRRNVGRMSVSQALSTSGTVDLLQLADLDAAAASGLKATLTYEVSSAVALDLDLKIATKRKGFWFRTEIELFSIVFGLTTDSSTTLAASITAAKVNKFLTWDRVFMSKSLRPVNIQAGPIPVVIVPTFEIAGVGEATFSAGFSSGYTVKSTQRLGVKYDAHGFGPVTESNSTITGDATLSAGVKAQAGVEVRLPTRLYGVAGPLVKASTVLDASETNTTDGTTRKVGVSIVVGIGADISILKKRLGKFEHEWTLFRKSLGDEFVPRPEPSSVPTATVSPTEVPQPAPSESPEPSPEPTETSSPGATPTDDPTTDDPPETRKPIDFGEPGTVWAWGPYNSPSENREDVWVARASLRRVPGIVGVSAAVSPFASYVVDSEGTLWAWGQAKSAGRLGGSTETVDPAPLDLPGQVVDVAPMGQGATALLEDGTMWAWGPENHDALGLPSEEDDGRIIGVTGACEAKQVSGGYTHALALCEDGSVIGWGRNLFGQVGPDLELSSPHRVVGLPEIAEVFAVGHGSAALDVDGGVWTWGSTQAMSEPQMEPTRVDGLPPIVDLHVADDSCVALDDTGQVWGWGQGSYGALGLHPAELDGFKGPMHNPTAPMAVAIGGGDTSFFLQKPDGLIWAWGWIGGLPSRHGHDYFTEVPVRLDEYDDVQFLAYRPERGVVIS